MRLSYNCSPLQGDQFDYLIMFIGSCNTIKQETQQNETAFQQETQQNETAFQQETQQKLNKIVVYCFAYFRAHPVPCGFGPATALHNTGTYSRGRDPGRNIQYPRPELNPRPFGCRPRTAYHCTNTLQSLSWLPNLGH